MSNLPWVEDDNGIAWIDRPSVDAIIAERDRMHCAWQASEARAERAESALMIYGEHIESCALHPGAPCTCGLLEILETIPEYQALAADRGGGPVCSHETMRDVAVELRRQRDVAEATLAADEGDDR